MGSERNGARIGERVGGKEGEKYREANIIIIAIGQLALAAVYGECTWNVFPCEGLRRGAWRGGARARLDWEGLCWCYE